jgi:hypothetical protein
LTASAGKASAAASVGYAAFHSNYSNAVCQQQFSQDTASWWVDKRNTHPKTLTPAAPQVGTVLMDLACLELLQRAPAREAQKGPGSSAGAISARAAAAAARSAPSLNDRERRLASLVVRQDKFLYIAVATLLHLAEEPSVKRKMRKKVGGWEPGLPAVILL